MTIPNHTEIPNHTDARPLRTEDDVLDRVIRLVGRAETEGDERTLWLMLADGDGYQLPAVMPISGTPATPDRARLRSLQRLIGGLAADLATARGPGFAFFTLERAGTNGPGPDDRAWESGVLTVCGEVGLPMRGFFLCTPAGVHRMS